MLLQGLIGWLITVLVVVLVSGLIVWLIEGAPMLDAAMKLWARWLVIVIAVLFVILRALPLLGVTVP